MVIVLFYDIFGNEVVMYIVNKVEFFLVFVDKLEKVKFLLEGVENKLILSFKIIVFMDVYGSELVEWG